MSVSYIKAILKRPFLSAHYLIYEIFSLNLTFTIYRQRDSKSLYYFSGKQKQGREVRGA